MGARVVYAGTLKVPATWAARSGGTSLPVLDPNDMQPAWQSVAVGGQLVNANGHSVGGMIGWHCVGTSRHCVSVTGHVVLAVGHNVGI